MEITYNKIILIVTHANVENIQQQRATTTQQLLPKQGTEIVTTIINRRMKSIFSRYSILSPIIMSLDRNE